MELEKNTSTFTEVADLPSDISNQFKSEVLDRSTKLTESSLVSHVSFGRQCFFGLVQDSSGKKVNVHLILDPETKTLKKASCGCFRSNTRTYCHHIVSFVRYVLRSDPDTLKLRTLEDDYENSFWQDISWFGYRHFGDSLLGFKAQVDHGGDGIRIGYSDRDGKEILSFMPGHRLVEEFLHEFFDIIRRDIDPILFKRMYGRKLKDPKVPSLRRRPWPFSESEEQLNKRGMKSTLQQQEDSIWNKIAKVGYLICGRGGGDFHFSFLEHKLELTVEGHTSNDDVILRFTPPRAHIGTVIGLGENKGVIGSDLFIHPSPLKTGHRIEVTESSALRIVPIVENPDPDAPPEEEYLDRTLLEDHLFGQYYFFPNWGFFKIKVSPNGLPTEYFSARKENTIPPEEISAFMEEYGEKLRKDSHIFLDPQLLDRHTIETYKKATIEHKSFDEDGVSITVDYDFGDCRISLQEILEARKAKKRYLVKGNKWIDAQSSQFAWMDGLGENVLELSDSSEVKLARTEYIRFLALHDDIDKRFSSAKVQNSFKGLEGLKAPTRLPSIKAMKGTLRPYQKNGYGWLWYLYENHFSGLLCDDMGLGKTHQVMALMAGILQIKDKEDKDLRYLVICPTSVLSHWKDKIEEYCPALDPHIYHGTDRSFESGFQEHRTIVTSYGIALRDIEMLADYQFELIVLDEIQAIKNSETKTHAAVKALQSVCAIGLTGTPIENSLTDLKALFDIILPGYLMTKSQFENHFRVPIEEESNKESERKLTRMIHPFVLRRKKEQVLKELPPKIEDVRRCTLSNDQISFYKDIIHNQGSGIVQQLKDPDKKVPYMHVFAVLNYLKQICNHPVMLEEDPSGYTKYESGKWDLFVELLDESLVSGQKVVVFSQYVRMLAIIEAFLKDRQIDFASIKGETRQKKRAPEMHRFNSDPNCMVFTASLRAAGLGIDLTGGSVVIHYDRWWNSAREDQATDRVHRIGQRRGVQVFKLVTENTLEEKIDRIISRKHDLMNSIVRQDDQALLKHFTREELIELISFK